MLQKLNKFFRLIVAVILFFSYAACNHYYKAIKTENPNFRGKTVDSLKNQNRYFILRNGSDAYFMRKIVLSEDRKTLSCVLDSLPQNHQLYLTHGRNGNMRYKPKLNDDVVLSEVHLFINSSEPVNDGQFILDLNKIQRIEVIEKDKKKTTSSYVIGALGYTIGAFAVAAIIVAATKSSCPFVSAYTNNEFSLQGEIFGGAIYPQLARDDYMPLKIQPLADGTLQVKISNELQERQYTDMANMLVVTHSQHSQILADEKGNLYEINDPQTPVKAWTSNREDALPFLKEKNDDALLYFDDTLAANAINYLNAEFRRPAGVQKGKLILSLKNSYWLDYLYGEMAKGLGSYYPAFFKKQSRTPVPVLKQWTKDQNIPLEISIRTKSGWKNIASLTTIGPLATRQIVVPVDLSDVDKSVIEIKCGSGFMFWEIDYAAMDFSENSNFKVEELSPASAVDETGKNVLDFLKKNDGKYLEQPVPGNCVTLKYALRPDSINSRSYIFHTKGYYIHVRDFKGAPKIAFLKQFKSPGGFSSYSLQLYKKLNLTTMESLAKQ